jgi:flagellar protein FlgJ
MTPLDPRLTQAAGALAADGRSLDRLKREAQRDPRAAMRQAAQQFEALFMQMVLKSMREATPKSGLFDSHANDMYTGLLDQQMALRMAQQGTGLAEVIVRQLTRHLPQGPEPVAAGAAQALARYGEVARHGETSRAGDAAAGPAPSTGATAGPAPASGATAAQQRDFISRHWDAAVAAQHATGIPAHFVLAQAALESGWGRAEIRAADGAPSFNLFGIKATGGWRGRTVEAVTTEYEDGVAQRTVERFRAYDNYGEAFRDWARLLAGNPRYAEVIARGADAQAFASGLQRAGYATDPAYGDKLARVIASVGAVVRS